MRRFWIQVLLVASFAALLAALVLPVIANGNRICFAAGAVRAAVFMQPDRIEVYTINEQDRGELQLSYLQSYLVTLPGLPSSNLLLGASDVNTHVEMWRTSGGQYMVLAGPDSENKMHECIFGGSSAQVRTYLYSGEALAASGDPDDVDTIVTVVVTTEPGQPTGIAATNAQPTNAQPTAGQPTAVQPTQQPTSQPEPPTPVGTREVTFGG